MMKNKKIFLVDNEFNMVTFLCTLIKESGLEPIVVENIDECCMRIKNDPPECVIINIMTFAEDGIFLYIELRKEKGLTDLPVILLSPIPKKTFNQYPVYKKAREELKIPEPDAYLEIPSETNEIVPIVNGFVNQSSI
jgi:response regulator RpfG family c-di-GMP phosphodiesterase